MVDSSSKGLGPCAAECFEFRLAPNGESGFVMVSYNIGCMFIFTSQERLFSPQLCNSVLDILLKVKRF
jgi:hypothetical protein